MCIRDSNIDEQLITAKDDGSLYDNARGFSNFAAPGADRLRIKTELSKKGLTDYNDTNFIELLRVDDGEMSGGSISASCSSNRLS